MADKQIKATAKLFLDTTNAASDAKQFFADLKKYMDNAEKAGSKFEVFKELGDYISDIDAKLTTLKNKNEDAFKHMFDGVDENLHEQMQSALSGAQKLVDEFEALNNQIVQTSSLKTSLGEAMKIVNQFNMGEIVDGIAKTEKEVLELVSTFKTLHDYINDPKVDKSSVQYYEKLIQYMKTAAKLAGSHYVYTAGDAEFSITNKDNRNDFLKAGQAASSYIAKIDEKFNNVVNKALDGIISNAESKIKNLKLETKHEQNSTPKKDKEIDDNEKLASSYDELKKKLRELAQAQAEFDEGKEVDDDGMNLEDKMNSLSDYIVELDKTGKKEKEISQILEDFSFGDIDEDKALVDLCNTLQIEMPQTTDAIEQAGNAAQEAEAKVESFLSLSKSLIERFDFEDVEIGQFLEQLDTVKNELQELATQGVITEQRMDDIFNAYKRATGWLDFIQNRNNKDNQNQDDNSGGTKIALYEDADGQLALFDGLSSSAQKAEESVEELEDAIKKIDNIDGQISLFDDKQAEQGQKVNDELKEQISLVDELKAKATQYTDLQSFVRKNAKDLMSIGIKNNEDANVFWRDANYNREDFQPVAMAMDDVADVIRDKVPENILDGWFRNADSSYKSRLERIALTDTDVRNAALNVMWDNYKQYSGKDISYDDFLHSEIPVYRGKNSEKYVDGDELLSFTFDKSVAEKFGNHVYEAMIRPIDTIGAYQTTAESEVLVRRDKLEALSSFATWLNNMTSGLDKSFVQAETIVDNSGVISKENDELREQVQLEQQADATDKPKDTSDLKVTQQENDALREQLDLQDQINEKKSGVGQESQDSLDDSETKTTKKTKSKLTPEQKVAQEVRDADVRRFKGLLKTSAKGLDFSLSSTDLEGEQAEIKALFDEASAQVIKFADKVQEGEKIEVSSIEATIAALQKKTKEYKKQNNLYDSGSKKNDTKGISKYQNIITTIESKRNTLLNTINKDRNLTGSSVIKEKLGEYEVSLGRVKKLYEQFKTSTPTDADIIDFKSASSECNNLHRELEKVVKTYQKMHGDVAVDIPLDNFVNNATNRKQALQDYIDMMYGSRAKIVDWKNDYHDLLFTINNGDGTFTEAKASIDNLGTSLVETAGDTKRIKSGIETFVDSVKGKMKSLSSYFTAMFGVQEVIQMIRKGVQSVKEIDTALTELKKVTDETNTVYNEFLQTASKTAKVVGSTVSDFVSATADFARLGYDITEASELAKAASVYKNVGDGIEDISQASESIISTMKAFGIEANNSMGIVDRFNEIGNNFAISSTGIGEAMQRSASALFEAGNTIDESIGLITAANSVVQNPEQVGTALKTLALRLRGAKVELEEAGLEADNMAESTSTLQAKLLALTHGKVDIMLDADTFKNTTQILREMAGAWEHMTDIERASALELMGGKRQANILSSLIKNFDTVEDVIETSASSTGSALAENEKYLDSIQGKIDQFNNSLQTMWMNFINADAVKFLVSAGTSLVDVIDKVGVLETAIVGIVGYLTLIKKHDWSKLFNFDGITNKTKSGGLNLLGGSELQREIDILNAKIKEGPEAFEAYKNAQKETNNGMYQMMQTTEKTTYTTQDYTNALKNMTPAAQQAAQKQQKLNTAIGLGIMAVTLIMSAIREYVDSLQTLEEEYDSLQSSITTLESNISSIDSELQTIQDQIDALSNKNLTFTEAEELKKLREQSAELQRQKDLQEKILEARKDQNSVKSLAMINNMLKTTAANQEKAAENGKIWGKVIGGIVGAAGTIAGIALTVGTGGIATGAGLALAGLGMSVGSELGGWAGEKWRSSSKATENGTLIEWYDSYTEAIEEANIKASEAEQKYFSDMSDKNYEKWQKRLDEVNTLQAEMYNGLEEMQEYVGNLEYNDSTKSIIDSYNDLMAHIDVEFNDGNIDAQISSIQALKTEFYSLSRGVDENGKNVALSAEEYARYLDIVDQILAYTPGLIQGYDKEGNAILGTANAQLTYNQLIAESIELLKEQRRQAAADSVTNEALGEVLSTAQDNYKSSVKGAVNVSTQPGTLRYNSGSISDSGTTYDDSVWSSSDNMFTLVNVLGESMGVFESRVKYIERNIDLIAERRGEIEVKLLESMTSKGVDDDRARQYVDGYMSWLDTVVEAAKYAEEQANAQIRERLYNAPQSSTYYDELSGSQAAFINNYISGLEGLKDKSKDELAEIRDDIIRLTNTIGQDEGAQKLIDDLFALDPSKMPVQNYKDAINGIFDELVNDEIITDAQRITITNQLFPDINDIDKMQEQVGKKLKATSQGLVKNLTLPELRIAYKYLLEEADGSLSFEELKEKIAEYNEELDGPIVNTYSALTQQIDSFNEVLLQSSEVITDNTLVTQEFKDQLIELGATEEDLAECFDSNNDLVVKNAKSLKDLTEKLKKNNAQNIKLAKSQAKLKYYELFKKMQNYIDAQGNVVKGKAEEIIALYEEMSVLEKVIAKYSMLETQLLGTTNAYEKFKQAQEADSETDYIGGIEEMTLALGQAFNTAELGTEAAQAAIAGLVPESVYKDLDTVDQKMAAIYQYFKEGKLSQYLTLEFDDDGGISSAEMKLSNLKQFVEDGLVDQNGDGLSVFSGEDWQHFELNQKWLDSLPKGVDKLQALADEFNVTKDIAFAFFEGIEDHDIEWLNGDYSSMLEELLPESLEYDIYNAMNGIADLNAKLAEGKINPKEYADEFARLNAELEDAKDKSRTNLFGSDGVSDKTADEIASMDVNDVDGYLEWQQKYTQITERLKDATNDYYDALDAVSKAKEEGREATEEEIKALEDAEKAVADVSEEYDKALEKKKDFSEPTELEIQVLIDDINEEIERVKDDLDEKLSDGKHTISVTIDGKKIKKDIVDTESLLDACFHTDDDGYWVINAGVDKTELETKYPEILSYVDLLNSTTTLTATSNTEEAEDNLKTINDTLVNIQNILSKAFKLKVDADGAIVSTSTLKNLIDGLKDKTVTITQKVIQWVTGKNSEATGTANMSGTAHVYGTAHKSGNWGLPQAEKGSLVGELGPEMVVDPRSGKYYTVGDSGAEMVNLPKGAIIFNHKQTEELLKNGHTASRGKAYAEGNAHVTIWSDGASKDQITSGNSGNSTSDNIKDDAEEVVDFIEMKIEKIEAIIEKTSNRIANFLDDTTSIKSKDELYDELIKAEKDKSEAYLKAAQKYNVEAAAALSGVPQQYQEMARNGAIEIKDFIGEDQVEIAEKIQEYRDWAAKADEAENGHLEAIAAISAHRVEQLEDIATDFENIISIAQSHSDLLQAEMDFIEESGGRLSEDYYEELKKHSQKQLNDMQAERVALQKILDDSVAAGDVVIGSDDWYSMLETIYEVDKEIIDCKTSLEEFQNAINDLYWDNFDKFIAEIENVESELSNLYDLVSDADDVVDEMGNWTDDGITALGLLAQQMENAQYKSKQYGEAIEKLKKDYANGLYSVDEYNERLSDLTDSQYDAIKSYEDAKDAIVDLNKTRVDAVKDGMQKEIDAYEELISKKKEALSEDKAAYDFQKQVQESNKNIEDIERKIAALAGDTSSSAMAQRKRLEAELLKAREELQDLYYDHSVEKQQEALDKELEDYTKNKEDQMDALDEYLKKEEQVIADSFDLVAENTKLIANTLIKISEEYGVTISDTVATPWIDGANAIGIYQEQLNTSVSATTANLETLKQYLEDLQTQADKTAESIVAATHSTVVSTSNGQQTSIKGYAKGSKSVEYDQWALIDELGDELQLVPNSFGRLDYIKKGTGILNNTLTEKLMDLAMDPTSILENNRPVIGAPGITNTNNTFTIDASVGTLLHVEHLDGSNPAEVAKLVDKAWEKKMQTLNNSIKKFTR